MMDLELDESGLLANSCILVFAAMITAATTETSGK